MGKQRTHAYSHSLLTFSKFMAEYIYADQHTQTQVVSRALLHGIYLEMPFSL